MTEITLPPEVIDKVIQAMANNMLQDGLTYSLRSAIEGAMMQRITESKVIDELGDAIVTYVLANQDAIVEHIGDEFIEIVGDSMATIYKKVADALIKRTKW